jgi:hypothetical protein
MIGALAIITLVILIGIIIYDHKVLAKRKLILHHLWRIASTTGDPVGMPVRKIKLMEVCHIDAIQFSSLIRKLSNEGIIHSAQDVINLTDYGKQHYEFKVKPEYIIN